MTATSTSIEFVMHGARTALAGGLSHIEEQIKGIERAVLENPGLAFDLAKTVVESACKTILTERKVAFDPGDDLPRLFKTLTQHLPVLPIEASSEAEARKSILQTLSGLHTALQGICELRNAHGFASHGSDGPRPAMASVQALLAARAADTIVGFIHGAHRQALDASPKTRLEYDDHQDFNRHVDDSNPRVKIFDLTYQPSEVLFAVDQEAYRDKLAVYQPGVDAEVDAPPAAPGGGR